MGEHDEDRRASETTDDPDREPAAAKTYECSDCGHRTHAAHQPGECPNCGGAMVDISVSRE